MMYSVLPYRDDFYVDRSTQSLAEKRRKSEETYRKNRAKRKRRNASKRHK